MPREIPIPTYGLTAGRLLAGKYLLVSRLGGGWEGEVYRIRELETGIERTAKFFFPQRNPGNRTLRGYAEKLHKLRHCPILIQYHTREMISFRGRKVTFLVSEFVEGDLLSAFLDRQPGKRLTPFKAVHLLHSLAAGMESIHNYGEYHGDLHVENVIVERYGLRFDLKLVDLYHRDGPRRQNIAADVVDMVTIFYHALGGQRWYSKQPTAVKEICCGLKHGLILRKYRTAGQLRRHLESLEWDS